MAPVPVQVLVDEQALVEMFPSGPGQTKGVFSGLAIAKFVAKVVLAVIGRFRAGSDHGAYTTMVEEVLCAAYLAKGGQSIWREMKKDAEGDTFHSPRGVGDIVLLRWKQLFEEQRAPIRSRLCVRFNVE